MRRISVTWRRALLIVILAGLCATASAALYANSGKSRIHGQPGRVEDGVNIILDLKSVDPAKREVTLRAELVPTGSYLNSAKDAFAVPIRMTTKNVVLGAVTTDIHVGHAVGKDYELIFPLEGNPQRYPLDHYDYHYEYTYTDAGRDIVAAPLIRIEKMVGDRTEPVPVGLWAGPDDGPEGWTEHWKLSAEGPTLKAKLSVERAGGLQFFVAIVLLLLVVIAVLAVLVAWSAIAGHRPVETGYAGWLAVLLFAIIPLRINLPGAPPIGAWIDAVVFYWIEVAVLASLAVFVIAWFRFNDRPDYTKLHEARARRQ